MRLRVSNLVDGRNVIIIELGENVEAEEIEDIQHMVFEYVNRLLGG